MPKRKLLPKPDPESCKEPHLGHWARVRDHFFGHVRLWATTVGAIVVLGGYIVTSTVWMRKQIDSFQTDEEAQAEYKKIREEMANEFIKVRAESKQMGDRAERNRLWLLTGQVRLEALVLRNRVNDCNDKKLQNSTCDQYRDELKDAQERYNEARKIAQEASR